MRRAELTLPTELKLEEHTAALDTWIVLLQDFRNKRARWQGRAVQPMEREVHGGEASARPAAGHAAG
jgi:hypothetical protein